MKPYIWDYDLPDDWQPTTDAEWEWFLVRKINYNDLTGITKKRLEKHFPYLTQELDPGKRILIEYFLTHSK